MKRETLETILDTANIVFSGALGLVGGVGVAGALTVGGVLFSLDQKSKVGQITSMAGTIIGAYALARKTVIYVFEGVAEVGDGISMLILNHYDERHKIDNVQEEA